MTVYPKVVVLILNWNGKDLTRRCLESFSKVDYRNCQVVVVDNGSTDGSEEQIRMEFPSVHVIQNGKNLGIAEGINQAIPWALEQGAEFLFIMNNDTKVDQNCVSQLVKAAEAHPSFGILGPVAFDYNGKELLPTAFNIDWATKDWCPFVAMDPCLADTFEGPIYPADIVQGDAFFVRRSVFEKIGLFDSRFFLMHEESDFCYRAKERGFQIGVVRNARFYRMISATIGAGTPMRRYYAVRNMFLFIWKNLRGLERFRKMIWELKRMKWAVWDYYVANYLRTKDKKYLKEALPTLRACFDFLLGRFGKARVI